MIARTEQERAALREGGSRLARMLQVLKTMVRPGVSTQELENKARSLVAKQGDELAFLGYRTERSVKPYPAALCVSVNDFIVHGVPNLEPRTIAEGDVVSLDFGIRHAGLYTDSALTVIAGSGSREDETLVRAVHEALERGIEQARVGNTLGDIGHAVQSTAERYGFGYPTVLCGHGVGRKLHEEPHVLNWGEAGAGEPIVEGLVIAIEPMFMRGKGEVVVDRDGHSYRTKDGSRAAHAEHTVLVTREGPEVLTEV
jgi:methionyl aminopeptidase